MVYFKDLYEDGNAYLCVTSDSTARVEDAKHKFLVCPSLSRPDSKLSVSGKKIELLREMTIRPDKTRSRPTYVLLSTLKTMEEESGFYRPFMFGREIILNGARWGLKLLKFPGEFMHLPSYWEWTEDVIARCTNRLKYANLLDAVYASLYSYDYDVNLTRAFCESWCPQTNTLHTEAGEWSLSLWDLEKLGGLSASGHSYDEAMPDTTALSARDKNDKRLIPRAFEYLFSAYCFLKDQRAPEEGVSAMQWIRFWCKSKREKYYAPPPRKRPRGSDTRSKNTHNPTGEISLQSLNWTSEELEVFEHLRITDVSERKTAYLAAYLSCWLCVFALPEHDLRLIRPNTFEVAARMASGERFSMAVPVLASIYHGLNKLVVAKRPSVSDSFFPAHYLYGWLAHYFRTHHDLPSIPIGPLMVQYSGHCGAKIYEAFEARELIHSGISFRAASLLLSRNKCITVCDDNKQDPQTVSYIISLRTAYLPLRSGTSFFLEPYHPTRFARQFGFYQEIPGVLSRFQNDGELPYAIALEHLRALLHKGSQTRVTIPGCLLNWAEFASPDFVQWWRAVTVTDLREKVAVLVSSSTPKMTKRVVDANLLKSKATEVDPTFPPCQQKKVTAQPVKRARDNLGADEGDQQCHEVNRKMRVYGDLFGMPPGSPQQPVDDVSRSPAFNQDVSNETPVQLAAESSSTSGSSTPFEDARTTASLLGSKGGGVTICTASILPQDQLVNENADFTRSMADLVKDRWVKKLRDTAPEQVEAFVAGADVFYQSIQNFGGDTTEFRAKVNAYVSCVKVFLAAREGVTNDGGLIDHDIVKVERNLQSARATLKDARQAAMSQEKQLLSIAERRAKLQASLQALDDEETRLKHQHSQQLEEISHLEPGVRTLEQQREDLKVSKSKIKRLKEMEQELNTMKKNLDVAP